MFDNTSTFKSAIIDQKDKDVHRCKFINNALGNFAFWNEVHLSLWDLRFSQCWWFGVFWVVMPWSVVVGCQYLRGPCCLHHQAEVHGARKWT